jgi:hypothetical protein
MAIHQVFNLTPFEAAIVPCQDRDGGDLAVAVLKATFQFGPEGEIRPTPHDAQLPVFTADVFWGDPATSSLRYARDISPAKPGTDVAVVGSAYGRGRKEVNVGFRLGALQKILVVSGPRVWAARFPVTVAGPVPFDKLPMSYEHAFGGGLESGTMKCYCEANPAGVGLAERVVDRAPLPSIEYPGARFRSVKTRIEPAGLGFVPPGWQQRAAFGGTYDAEWEKTRRPLMAADLDERFWNTVPQDQVLVPKLAGGERLVLVNLHPESDTVSLTLPRLGFSAAFRVKDSETVLPMSADTVLVEADEGRIALTFRAILTVGDDLMRLASVVFRNTAGPAARAGGSSPARSR